MKRFRWPALFFIGLFFIWHLLVLAKIWSAVLLPHRVGVWEYLKGASGGGMLPQASLVTIRRPLAATPSVLWPGLPLELLRARFKFAKDTVGVRHRSGFVCYTLTDKCVVAFHD